MEIEPIKTEKDYDKAIALIDSLWGVKKNTPGGNEFEILVKLIENYEAKHYPIGTHNS